MRLSSTLEYEDETADNRDSPYFESPDGTRTSHKRSQQAGIHRYPISKKSFSTLTPIGATTAAGKTSDAASYNAGDNYDDKNSDDDRYRLSRVSSGFSEREILHYLVK